MYEPHLLQPQAYQEMLERLEHLSLESPARFGKMDVAQMLAHVTANLEMAMSGKKVKQTLEGRIFGFFAKHHILSKGVPKNIPSGLRTMISDPREFDQEKKVLERKLEHFYKGGEGGITQQPHDFFERMTVNEWSRLQYVHVDHHFKQFGV